MTDTVVTIIAPACKASATFKTPAGGLAFMEFMNNKLSVEQFAAVIGKLYGSEFASAAQSLALICAHNLSF